MSARLERERREGIIDWNSSGVTGVCGAALLFQWTTKECVSAIRRLGCYENNFSDRALHFLHIFL